MIIMVMKGGCCFGEVQTGDHRASCLQLVLKCFQKKKKKAYLYTHMEKDRETEIEMPQISEILTENLGEGALGVLCAVLEMFL